MLVDSIFGLVARSVLWVQNGLLAVPLAVSGWMDGDPFDEARSGVYRIYRTVKGLLEVVIVMAALIILVRIVLKMMSGDKDSARHLLWWVIGLAFGFAMLEVLYGLAI